MCRSSQRDSCSVPERPSVALLSDTSCIFVCAANKEGSRRPNENTVALVSITDDNVLFLLFASSLFCPLCDFAMQMEEVA